MKLKKRLSMVLVFAVLMSTLGLSSPAYAMGNAGDQCIGQISLFAFDFEPMGWVLCDGRTLSISENTALYSLIGTTFGGNGTTTFGVPNLTNASPISRAKYYMSIDGIWGFDYANLTIGEVCLLPDQLVQRTDALGSFFFKCDGSTRSISTYSAFFSVIGTTFGGDGISTFCVPNLTNVSPLEGLSYYIVCNGLYPTMDGAIDTYELIGSIDLFAFTNRTFNNSAVCNGQTLALSSYNALYSLIGSAYGGNTANFAVPDLRGAVPSSSFRYYMITWGIFPIRS